MTAEQALALEGLTSEQHEREMSTLFTDQTLHKNKYRGGTCLWTFGVTFSAIVKKLTFANGTYAHSMCCHNTMNITVLLITSEHNCTIKAQYF